MALNDIKKALDTLKDGGAIIYPTETCYGIGCVATDKEAVEKVFKAKKRPESKKLTCIVADMRMARRHAEISELGRRICERFMPGPLTFIADKRPGSKIPETMNSDFAFRVSSDSLCRTLSKEIDSPLVATSANISGRPSNYSTDTMSEELLERADYVLDRGQLEKNTPSTIAGIKDGSLKVFREGPITRKQLESFVEVVSDE